MNFFQTYQDRIIYLSVVIASVFILRWLTNLLYRKLAARTIKKFPEANTYSLRLVRQILIALWFVLGAILVFYLSTPEEEYTFAALTKDFKLMVYLGFVSIATIVGASIVNIWFLHHISKRQVSRGDATNLKFLRYVAIAGIYFSGFLLATLAFPSFRGIAQTALGGAGVVALVIGIASREALSNIFGGLLIIAFKPFKIGDVVMLADGMEGAIADITLRHTVIRNFDNKMIVIPNSIINNERITNYDLGELKCCERIEIGISYDSDIDLAKKIMKEECENHPLIFDNRSVQDKEDGLPIIRTAVTKLNDFSMTIRAWAWVKSFDDSFRLRCDIYESVKKRFDKEGIEIPFPYRTVVMKSQDKESRSV